MGLPQINIIFQTKAKTSSKVANRGVLGVVIKDSGKTGAFVCYSKDDIPDTLTASNQAYLEAALLGNVNAPKKLVCYSLGADKSDYTDALEYLAGIDFDYLVAAPDVTEEQAEAIVTWIKAQRKDYNRKYKAVLPNTAADSIAIINVAEGIDGKTPGELCSRIAGIICGTPLNQSITYVAIPEATSCTAYSNADLNTAIDAGKLMLLHDGEKVKIARERNSLVTLTKTESTDQWKSIKLVETMDVLQSDLRKMIADNYIGKYYNSFENKMLLVSAVSAYLSELESQGILGEGSTCDIDVDATKAWLKEQGSYTDGMTDDEIRTADTGSHVFLAASVKMYYAVEDVTVNIEV